MIMTFIYLRLIIILIEALPARSFTNSSIAMLWFLVEVVHNVQVGPWLLALFIFVVCGSAIFQIIQSIRMA